MGGIPPIAFLSSERLDVLWVHQHQIKTPFQDVPHRPPVHASCFHNHMGYLMFCKPCGHILEFPGKGAKAALKASRVYRAPESSRMPRCSSCVRPAHCIVSATLPYTPSFWTPPVAAARKGSSPTCSLVAESHNSLCLCAAGCKLSRGFETPVTLRSRPATPTPIFIPCCGLEKAMCNSLESDP